MKGQLSELLEWNWALNWIWVQSNVVDSNKSDIMVHKQTETTSNMRIVVWEKRVAVINECSPEQRAEGPCGRPRWENIVQKEKIMSQGLRMIYLNENEERMESCHTEKIFTHREKNMSRCCDSTSNMITMSSKEQTVGLRHLRKRNNDSPSISSNLPFWWN